MYGRKYPAWFTLFHEIFDFGYEKSAGEESVERVDRENCEITPDVFWFYTFFF